MNTKAWNAIKRFTSPSDRRPITETTHGADKLRRVVSARCGYYEWQKVDAYHSPTHIMVGVRFPPTDDCEDRLLLLKDGQQVPSFDTPDFDTPDYEYEPSRPDHLRESIFSLTD